MIARTIESSIFKRLSGKKAVILLGPHQVGKTTLLKSISNRLEHKVLWLNGDDPGTIKQLETVTLARWKLILGNHKLLIVDEAQRIENIGLKLKLVIDNLPDVQVIASGSSAFELANTINEPLTGRKWSYDLFPLSFSELVNHHGYLEEIARVEERLVYGYYPEVVTGGQDAREILVGIADSYLFKDILTWANIRKPDKLMALLQSVAYQLGNEVSYNELGKQTGLDNQTVEQYILLLERAFIIYRLPPFSRNLRNEIKSKRKIYFYDNGIRNAVIAQFQHLPIRQDVGALWENFLLAERLKMIRYERHHLNRYFWRTTQQQEIDYLEEKDGTLTAYEFKWNPKRKVKVPSSFRKAYPQHAFQLVNRDNFTDFLLG